MNCCPLCFDDEWLKRWIQETAKSRRKCDFCSASKVMVLPAGELADAFQNLLTMYTPAESYTSGEPLVTLIQEDWEIFSDRLISRDATAALLEEIVNSDWDDDSGEPLLNARELYTSRPRVRVTMADAWREFCEERRRIPDLPPPFPELLREDLFHAATTLRSGTRYFRARPSCRLNPDGSFQPYPVTEMGAPSPPQAIPGRANREHTPVLYCASEEGTAVAEVRPARGSLISVCTLELTTDVLVLDLSKPVTLRSPFEKEPLHYWVDFVHLLNEFGGDLSRPLDRSDDLEEYAPCQEISDAVMQARFAGMLYGSALAPSGINLVLFDPGIVSITESHLVRVRDVRVLYAPWPVAPGLERRR